MDFYGFERPSAELTGERFANLQMAAPAGATGPGSQQPQLPPEDAAAIEGLEPPEAQKYLEKKDKERKVRYGMLARWARQEIYQYSATYDIFQIGKGLVDADKGLKPYYEAPTSKRSLYIAGLREYQNEGPEKAKFFQYARELLTSPAVISQGSGQATLEFWGKAFEMAWSWAKSADKNRDGFIDDDEWKKIAGKAQEIPQGKKLILAVAAIMRKIEIKFKADGEDLPKSTTPEVEKPETKPWQDKVTDFFTTWIIPVKDFNPLNLIFLPASIASIWGIPKLAAKWSPLPGIKGGIGRKLLLVGHPIVWGSLLALGVRPYLHAGIDKITDEGDGVHWIAHKGTDALIFGGIAYKFWQGFRGNSALLRTAILGGKMKLPFFGSSVSPLARSSFFRWLTRSAPVTSQTARLMHALPKAAMGGFLGGVVGFTGLSLAARWVMREVFDCEKSLGDELTEFLGHGTAMTLVGLGLRNPVSAAITTGLGAGILIGAGLTKWDPFGLVTRFQNTIYYEADRPDYTEGARRFTGKDGKEYIEYRGDLKREKGKLVFVDEDGDKGRVKYDSKLVSFDKSVEEDQFDKNLAKLDKIRMKPEVEFEFKKDDGTIEKKEKVTGEKAYWHARLYYLKRVEKNVARIEDKKGMTEGWTKVKGGLGKLMDEAKKMAGDLPVSGGGGPAHRSGSGGDSEVIWQ